LLAVAVVVVVQPLIKAAVVAVQVVISLALAYLSHPQLFTQSQWVGEVLAVLTQVVKAVLAVIVY
jgi:hypothetical protein